MVKKNCSQAKCEPNKRKVKEIDLNEIVKYKINNKP
jgi:hypothetical protein